MERRQLEVFLAATEYPSMAAAARHLHLSEPAVSQAIAALERDLGTRLFHRGARGIRLTSAGEVLVTAARKILRDISTAKGLISEVAGAQRGNLDLVSLPGLVGEPLAAWLGAYRRSGYLSKTRITQAETPADVIRAVRSGAAEVGLLFRQQSYPRRLRAHMAGTQELVAVLPPMAPCPATGSITVQAMIEYGLITGQPGTYMRDMVDDLMQRRGEQWRPEIEVERRDAALHFVLAGAGAVILPRSSAALAANAGAIVLSLAPRLIRQVHLLTHEEWITPAAAALLKCAGVDAPQLPAV